jgi:NAD(P)-dependent dehydrogenase (short-subunit alcohol dehydrogenase family)
MCDDGALPTAMKAPKSKRFAGKVFLVTGASSGIGEVIAKKLAMDGAHVVLTARRLDKLLAIKASIETDGGSASAEPMDVLQYEEVESVIKGIVYKHGKLDGAFNNAGGGDGTAGPLIDCDVKQFRKGFDLNFYGTYHCMKAELQVMTKQGSGSIVNNTSMLAKSVMVGVSNYCASKRAIQALQESAAIETASSNVRVNSVSPGWTTPSESLDAFLEANPAFVKNMTPPVVPASGGLISADEVYASVAFLLDNTTSGAITGIDIPVCGGLNIPQTKLV